MKNVNEVRDQLADLFEKTLNGEVEVEVADTLANIAGKMINSAKVQCYYYELRAEKPEIAFLQSTEQA